MSIKTTFYTFKQGNGMSLQRDDELFVGHVTVMDEVGISISDNATAYTMAQENDHDILTEEDYAKAKERALAMQFMQGANPNYNLEYLAHLRNSHLEGTDLYPKTLMEDQCPWVVVKVCHLLQEGKEVLMTIIKVIARDISSASTVE